MILFIDTTTSELRLLIFDEKSVKSAILNNPGRGKYSEVIMDNIDKLLAMANVKFSQLTEIAVNLGPGSFTGTRIGVSIAKGLAYGGDLSIIPLNNMELVLFYLMNAQKNDFYSVVLDAKRNEIFASIFDVNLNDWIIKPYLTNVKDFSNILKKYNDIVIGGSAAQDFESLFENAILLPNITEMKLNFDIVDLIYHKKISDIKANPLDIEPFYIRKSDAELNYIRKK